MLVFPARRAAALAVVGLSCSLAAAQLGSLTPPGGPVADTGPDLSQIQSWVPLNDLPGAADAAHVITEPGVYVLTGPINVGGGQHGVQISLDGLPPGEYYVCIVSNGHPIRMGAGSLNAIHYVDGVGHDETIQVIAHEGRLLFPISGAGGDGVHLEGAERVVCRGLQITNCAGDGVHVRDNRTAECENLDIRNCGGDGMDMVANLSNSYVCRKLDTAVSIRECGGSGSKGAGYHAYELKRCFVRSWSTSGIELSPSAFVGPSGLATSTTLIEGCEAGGGVGDGIRFTPATAGTYTFELKVTDSVGNGGSGVVVDNSVPGCDLVEVFERVNASGNGNHGIEEIHLGDAADESSVDIRWTGVSTNNNAVQGSDTTLGDVWCVKQMDKSTAKTNGGKGKKVKASGGYIAVQMEDCIVSKNGDGGVQIEPGAAPVSDGVEFSMDRCNVSANTGHGADFNWTQVGGPFKFTIKNSELNRNTMDGINAFAADGTGVDNNCNSNGGNGFCSGGACTIGIRGGSYSYNGADGYKGGGGSGGDLCIVTGAFNNNGGHGVRNEDTSCWIRVSQANGNGGDGFNVVNTGGLLLGPFRLEESIANGNTGSGVVIMDQDANLLHVSANNNMNGVVFDGTDPGTRTPTFMWTHCNGNALHGMSVGNAAGGSIRHSACSTNGEYGIWCVGDFNDGVIQNNHCSNNLGGIRVDGVQNVVQQNTATFGALGGVTVAAGNVTGMPVDAGNIATHSNPAANVEK